MKLTIQKNEYGARQVCARSIHAAIGLKTPFAQWAKWATRFEEAGIGYDPKPGPAGRSGRQLTGYWFSIRLTKAILAASHMGAEILAQLASTRERRPAVVVVRRSLVRLSGDRKKAVAVGTSAPDRLRAVFAMLPSWFTERDVRAGLVAARIDPEKAGRMIAALGAQGKVASMPGGLYEKRGDALDRLPGVFTTRQFVLAVGDEGSVGDLAVLVEAGRIRRIAANRYEKNLCWRPGPMGIGG